MDKKKYLCQICIEKVKININFGEEYKVMIQILIKSFFRFSKNIKTVGFA